MTFPGEANHQTPSAAEKMLLSADALCEAHRCLDEAVLILRSLSNATDTAQGLQAEVNEVTDLLSHLGNSALGILREYAEVPALLNPYLLSNGFTEIPDLAISEYVSGRDTLDTTPQPSSAVPDTDVQATPKDDDGVMTDEPGNLKLPKDTKVLDLSGLNSKDSLDRIGFMDGILAVNHGVAISPEGHTLLPREEKALVLGGLGLDMPTTAEVLHYSFDRIREYRKDVFKKIDDTDVNIARATVVAFDVGVLTVEKPIAHSLPTDDRYKQILTLIGRGQSNIKIAETLGMSLKNLKTELEQRMIETGALNRVGLLTHGIMSGQVDPKNMRISLPSHVSVLESNLTDTGLQIISATYKSGIVAINPDVEVPHKLGANGRDTLSVQQGNILLLSGLGLMNSDIAQALGVTETAITNDRNKIAKKVAGGGAPIGQRIVASIQNETLRIVDYIDADVIPLTSMELEVVSDIGSGRTIGDTASRLGTNINTVHKHLARNAIARIPKRPNSHRTSLLMYAILTEQYDPYTGAISPMG